jgi:hypothetical protein
MCDGEAERTGQERSRENCRAQAGGMPSPLPTSPSFQLQLRPPKLAAPALQFSST